MRSLVRMLTLWCLVALVLAATPSRAQQSAEASYGGADAARRRLHRARFSFQIGRDTARIADALYGRWARRARREAAR